MDKEFTNDLMKKLDKCLTENSEEYLNWDWEKIAQEQMTNFEQRSAAKFIDNLLYGYGGFKKYKYDRLLFNLLYTLAKQNNPEAKELLLNYIRDKDRRGFAADALGKLKEKSAVGVIVEMLRDALIFRPKLITYTDVWDHITLSSYVYMIQALKMIEKAEPDVLRILEDYSTKVDDESIRRDAREALESLKGKQ
jgi:hypothetical protein